MTPLGRRLQWRRVLLVLVFFLFLLFVVGVRVYVFFRRSYSPATMILLPALFRGRVLLMA